MTVTVDYEEAYWYARGYYDGRAFGKENLMEIELDDLQRQFYRQGYDCGVSDYCYFDIPDEVSG
jgi:hypothetical protein